MHRELPLTWTLIEHRGVLSSRLSNANTAWSSRCSLRLSLSAASGRTGIGEASPLPGYSPDTLEQCDAALRLALSIPLRLPELRALMPANTWTEAAPLEGCSERFPARTLEAEGSAQLEAFLETTLERIPAELPAARFALEMALLDLLGQELRLPVWVLLRSMRAHLHMRETAPPELGPELRPLEPGAPVDLPAPVPLAFLLPAASVADTVGAARAAVQAGFSTLKLKIGTKSDFSDDLSTIRALRSALPDDVCLRLDANGRLSPAAATEQLSALAELRPELLEEPLPWHQWPLLEASTVPLALDESLQQEATLLDVLSALHKARAAPDPASSGRGLLPSAVVLKPMALGGLLRCLSIGRHFAALGVPPIVSHLFDGPVALAAAAHLAIALQGLEPPLRRSPEPSRVAAGLAAGLAPHPGLSSWPGMPILWLGPTRITPPRTPGLGLLQPLAPGDAQGDAQGDAPGDAPP